MIIVLAWILFALLGLAAAYMGRRNAKEELNKLGDVGNGRLRLGKGHIRDETIIMVIDAVWAAIGLFYLTQKIAVSNPVVAVPLIGTSALLALSTFLRWRDRLAVYGGPDHAETPIERQDRVVGDQRRKLQAEDAADK